ncbi:two-component system response regulator YesN [Pullulanibacillus pueri]|uniref:Stage 0 sporulation protein A homolog n=1 Tax=Pullulanibacillus pueri TaxID=1437324 RepID=A0A8J2ZZ87_9BACL|nr:response regulator [Pullulanibacillus pueri]MBM7683308.1 two-component system response regulator YesN [Pullulanibacillus pueri]GGH86439.1 hypothetical protein GCM10007096_34150 [Pullulanibacillus pueri]
MYKVIIADDNPIICQALLRRIPWKELGLELGGICNNGKEVIEKLSEVSPDIIITDIRMPLKDGLSLIEQLRSRHIHSQIIIVSGYNDYMYLKKAIEFDVISYLFKPIQDEELLKGLNKAINNLRQTEELNHISNFAKTLEQREHIRAFNDCLLYLINSYHFQNLSSPSQGRWILFQIPFNNEHQFHEIDVEKLLDYKKILNKKWPCEIQVLAPVKTLVAVLCPPESRLAEDVTNFVHKLFKWDGILSPHYLLSHTFNNPNQMGKEFITSLTHLYSQIFDSVFSEESNNDSTQVLTMDIQQTLRTHLALSDYSGASQLLMNKLNSYLHKNPELTGFESFIRTTLQIYSEYIPSLTDLSKLMASNILSPLAFDSLERFFELIKNINNEQLKPVDITEEILKYIKRNYTQQLTLTIISKRFHYNNIYLGQLIKQKTGMSFNQYLNKLRVEQAVEILKKNNQVKITDLSFQLGYSDSRYFSKVFKKITGVSPSSI